MKEKIKKERLKKIIERTGLIFLTSKK